MSGFLQYFGKGKNTFNVFILEDDEIFAQVIQKYLSDNLPKKFPFKKFEFSIFNNPNQGGFMDTISKSKPDILILDYHLDLGGGKEVLGSKVLKEVQKTSPATDVIMLTGEDKLQTAIDLMKSGAFDYIVKSESATVNTLKSIGRVMTMGDMQFSQQRNKFFVNLLLVGWLLTVTVGVIVYVMTAGGS